MSEKEEKDNDFLFEDIEKNVETFQYFDEKSYSGKFLGYIKKIRIGISYLIGLLFLIMLLDIILIIFGDDATTWDDVLTSFTSMIIITLLGYILIFVLQGFSIIIKNNEDQILERHKNKE